MIFEELSYTTAHGYANCREFRKQFPEVDHIDDEKLAERFHAIGFHFYTEKQTKVNSWIRLTLPFAFLLIGIMILTLPLKFMITGRWNYSIGKGRIYNWFKKLQICC